MKKENSKTITRVLCISFVLFIISYIWFFILNDIGINQDKLISYLIKNENNIERDLPCENCFYVKDFNDKNYYTDMSISVSNDSSYIIILWGNRNHIMYEHKKDVIVTIDIPYNRYKGKDVAKQVRLYQILNSKIVN